jgi:hypothetical protein
MANTLVRELRYGEQISFENRRIVVRVEERSGKRVGLYVTLNENVVVDKPHVSANDASFSSATPIEE